MQQCKICGSTLPNFAHFCAYCGHVIDDFTQGATDISSPQEQDMQTLEVIPPIGHEDENTTISMQRYGEGSMFDSRYFDERRTDEDRAVLPGMILLGTEMVEGQAPAGNLPMVQGTPQVSGVPSVQGTPAMPAHAPAAQAIYHNAPASMPAAPSAPSWVPHTSPPEIPPAHHPRHRVSGELHTHHRRHQTSGELHTHHHRQGRRHFPRPHGIAQHLLVAAVAVIVIATSAVTGALAIFRPALSLHVNGGITPGGTFQLHGVNFTPGSSVTLTLDDGIPLSSLGHGDVGEASYGAGFANVLQLSISAERSLEATAQGTSIPVSIQGTFDVTIQVSQNWPAGVHTIHATDRVLGRTADLQFAIPPAQAKLVVTPSSVLDFGSLEIGRKVTLPVILGNMGGRQLHWTAGVGSTPWLKVQPASGTILPGNHEQVVNIVANASNLAAKDYSAVLQISSDAGAVQIAVKLKVISPGSTVKAILDVNPASLDFGTQVAGKQATLNVTLANTGTQALNWGADTGNASWLKLSSNSGKILPGDLPQILNVTADTTQLAAGNHSAILNITSNGGNKQITVTVVVAAAPAVLAVNPAGLNFGKMDLATSKILQETVSNSGGQPLTWNVDTGGTNWLSVDTGTGTIQPGSQQIINVTANTTNLSPGPYSATLNFTSNGGNKSVQVSLVVNTPIQPAQITVGPNPLDFGAIDPNATKTLQETINNSGGQPLTWKLDTASLPGWLSVDANNGTVQVGKQQTINVIVDTTNLSAGPYSATLNFTSNGGSVSVPVSLVVNAPPVIGASPNPLDFGAIDPGTSKTLPETISNSGGQPLTWKLDTASLPGWLSVDANNGTVQVGKQQAINVTANASNLSPGPYSATLNFTSNGGNATVPVTLTVNAPPPPVQRTLTSQQTQSQTVNATGEGTTPGTQASGTLRVENHDTTNPLTIKAGTILPNQNPNPAIHMQIDQDVFLPPTGYTDVPAHVVEVGTIGNLPDRSSGGPNFQNQCDSIHNCGPPTWDIFNEKAFTGGTDPQTYTVVTQSDIDTAANSLQASTRQSAVADLNSQLRPNEHLVGDPQCTYKTTSDHAANDQATTVTVTVMATCTATAST